MTRVLLTGSGGFVGHHVLEHLLQNTDWDVVCTDSFRHKGKSDRIAEVLHRHPGWRPRVRVIMHDLSGPFTPQTAETIGPVNYVIANASESHVGRSIDNPVPFVLNNVSVILTTLEFCREAKPKAVIVVSTDEVYGPEVDGIPHPEWDTILPSNPYSASKACQEAIAVSYWRSFGVPLQIVNCMNLIGERQDPEKYLPMLIQKIARGETITVHGTAEDIGTRHFLHARNLADGILFLLRRSVPMFAAHAESAHDRASRQYRNHQAGREPGYGSPASALRPGRWNVVGPDRISNLELAEMVADAMGRLLKYQLVDFHSAQPGHDPHYGLDPAKLTAAGWEPPVPFGESLERTIKWTLDHPEWML